MTTDAGRTVTVVVTCGDEDLGEYGPFEVASPWWADVAPVVERLRTVLGVPVVVLRLVDVGGGRSPRGGHVTYHAEALTQPTVTLRPGHHVEDLRTPATHRANWATASGVRATLSWADDALTALDRPATGPVEQVKTWNLSGLFRIPTGGDPVWLKVTPTFATYEADVIASIARVDPDVVPVLLATDPAHRRVLMAHVSGVDCWDALPALIRDAVTRWVTVQATLPVPDALPHRPASSLAEALNRLLDDDAGRQLTAAEMADARRLVERLPAIVTALDACGLPTTLVHGDFHPGNWRSDRQRLTFVDFADAFTGHPAFDGVRLADFLPPERREPIADAWCETWTRHLPSADPRRALRLAEPLAHLVGAVTYQRFLDNIETSERRYHEGDPATSIRDALASDVH